MSPSSDRQRILWTRIGEALIIGVLSALGARQTTQADLATISAEVRALSIKAHTCENEIAALKRDLQSHDERHPR